MFYHAKIHFIPQSGTTPINKAAVWDTVSGDPGRKSMVPAAAANPLAGQKLKKMSLLSKKEGEITYTA